MSPLRGGRTKAMTALNFEELAQRRSNFGFRRRIADKKLPQV